MWQSTKGYVIIQISEGSTERFLNHMRSSAIPMRDVRRVGPAIECRIPAKDFRRLRGIRRLCRCRVRIVQREGMPFLLIRLLERRALWIGCAAATVAFCLLSSRIWVIPITGCQLVPPQVVARALREQGIYPGASGKGLVLYRVAELARLYDQRIAAIELDLDGVVCRVTVDEAEPIGESVDRSIPTDVVAAKGGIISRIEPYNGAANVSVGQLVAKGDVLIRGDITQEGAEETLLVHAYGNVYARVSYFAEAAVPLAYTDWAASGRTERYRMVSLAGLPVFETEPSFDQFVLDGSAVSEALGTLLPIRITTGVLSELTQQTLQRTEPECIELALVEAEKRAYEKLPKNAAILEKQTSFTLRDGCVIGICCIVMEESIGYIKEIAH